MMPAFKMLAEACALQGRTGELNFGRCDFRALNPGYEPEAMDLYRVFNPVDFERVSQLHAYLTELNYKPVYQYYGMSGWEVKYQGSRVKRALRWCRSNTRSAISTNCASSSSVPLRTGLYRCWPTGRCSCRRISTGGPIIAMETSATGARTRRAWGRRGGRLRVETRTICWYTNPDVHVVDDGTVDLVKEYVLLHEALG